VDDLANELGVEERDELEWKRDAPDRDLLRTRAICALAPHVPATIDAPGGSIEPIGYLVLQHAVRLD
jgi:hypothetical protein